MNNEEDIEKELSNLICNYGCFVQYEQMTWDSEDEMYCEHIKICHSLNKSASTAIKKVSEVYGFIRNVASVCHEDVEPIDIQNILRKQTKPQQCFHFCFRILRILRNKFEHDSNLIKVKDVLDSYGQTMKSYLFQEDGKIAEFNINDDDLNIILEFMVSYMFYYYNSQFKCSKKHVDLFSVHFLYQLFIRHGFDFDDGDNEEYSSWKFGDINEEPFKNMSLGRKYYEDKPFERDKEHLYFKVSKHDCDGSDYRIKLEDKEYLIPYEVLQQSQDKSLDESIDTSGSQQYELNLKDIDSWIIDDPTEHYESFYDYLFNE